MDFEPIGIISSVYKEKFGVPRQSGLVPEARAILHLEGRFRDAVRGLEGFSHIWVISYFHDVKGWNNLVRPPRLDGKEKVGVLASRSPHRPNPLGISAVALEKIEIQKDDSIHLHLAGGDFLDQTPVIDIKPYVHYADSIPNASLGWAVKDFRKLHISFSPAAAETCERLERLGYAKLKILITQTLELDPRPAFQAEPETAESRSEGQSYGQSYGMKLWDFDIRFKTENDECVVTEIVT